MTMPKRRYFIGRGPQHEQPNAPKILLWEVLLTAVALEDNFEHVVDKISSHFPAVLYVVTGLMHPITHGDLSTLSSFVPT